MRKLAFLLVLLALLAFATTALAGAPASKNFMAVLSGANEVPANTSDAQGMALVQFGEGDSSLRFVLIAEKIENPVAAHIHCGAAGVNGPVGVTLFSGGAPGGGSFNGVLSKGEIFAPDPNAATNICAWTTIADVAAAVRNGMAYVNVHTNDGVFPGGTGPGDLPGGEIRGQLFEAGATP